MEYLLVGGMFGLVWLLSQNSDSNEFKLPDISNLINQLAREEQTLMVTTIEDGEAKAVVRHVFGSHHKYAQAQAVRAFSSEYVLFVAKAIILIDQIDHKLEFEGSHAAPGEQEVWWLLYRHARNGTQIGVSFHGWRIMKLLVNGTPIPSSQRPPGGPLGTLKGIGVRALRQVF
jgi:hypothetical protein